MKRHRANIREKLGTDRVHLTRSAIAAASSSHSYTNAAGRRSSSSAVSIEIVCQAPEQIDSEGGEHLAERKACARPACPGPAGYTYAIGADRMDQ